MISTICLAIVLGCLNADFLPNDGNPFCYLGLDDNHNRGSQSCVLGISVASLSSLVCTVFLAVEILSRDGLLRRPFVKPLGIGGFSLACITCLLWFAETIYAIHGFAVTVDTVRDLDKLPLSIRTSAAFFCTFSGLSIMIWVSATS